MQPRWCRAEQQPEPGSDGWRGPIQRRSGRCRQIVANDPRGDKKNESTGSQQRPQPAGQHVPTPAAPGPPEGRQQEQVGNLGLDHQQRQRTPRQKIPPRALRPEKADHPRQQPGADLSQAQGKQGGHEGQGHQQADPVAVVVRGKVAPQKHTTAQNQAQLERQPGQRRQVEGKVG